MSSIRFFKEKTKYSLPHPRKTSRWVKESVGREEKRLEELNFIFCSDAFLLEINNQFLNHDTYTDIVTFDNSDGSGAIEGDIYISTERVAENALKFGVPFDIEMHRVMIHGVLHLIGYSDKNPAQKEAMRKKEDAYLSLRK